MIKICKFCNKPVKCVNQHLSKKHLTEECEWSIEDHLREAIESVEDFIDITKKFDIRLSEEARLYILGHLRAFKDDQSQMGSVKSLYNGLTEKEEE